MRCRLVSPTPSSQPIPTLLPPTCSMPIWGRVSPSCAWMGSASTCNKWGVRGEWHDDNVHRACTLPSATPGLSMEREQAVAPAVAAPSRRLQARTEKATRCTAAIAMATHATSSTVCAWPSAASAAAAAAAATAGRRRMCKVRTTWSCGGCVGGAPAAAGRHGCSAGAVRVAAAGDAPAVAECRLRCGTAAAPFTASHDTCACMAGGWGCPACAGRSDEWEQPPALNCCPAWYLTRCGTPYG